MQTVNWAYNESDAIIGTVENSPEEGFPLAGCHNKAVITALELDKDFGLSTVRILTGAWHQDTHSALGLP